MEPARRGNHGGAEKLIADYGNFCGGNLEAHEAMSGIEEEEDFDVGSADFEAVVGFAVDGGGAGGFDGDGTGGEFLGDKYGESLRTAFVPIVDAGEDGVLVIKIVVEDGDERCAEGEILFEGAGALHFESDFGDAVGEENVGAVGFVAFGGPLVADGRAVGLQDEGSGNFCGGGLRRLYIGGALGDPTAGGGGDFEFFMADGLAVEFDGELAFVSGERGGSGARKGIFRRGETQRAAEEDGGGSKEC